METTEGHRWLDALASNRRLGDLATNPWRRTVVPAVSPTPVTKAVSGLELGPVIGEGGMAVVREAIQPQLGRGVAVKALRPEAATTSDARRLLQEAWTTGALEHPNIIPVHDIAWAADGSPRVLLKRVRGRAWSELLDDSGSPDLERDLRILLDVARALDFAHQAGFVHRDVKPSNVLIGEHGDVYLADWGIAVALHDDGTGRFPLAAEVDAMAGTPAYMAPEMVDPRVAPIGPWTDVYLLGAVLLELMSGEPPHDVTSAATLVTSVFAHPNIPGVDHELRAICARALAPQPADRYVGAGAFREAVADYLRYSGARAVAVRADASAAKWRACADKTSGEAEAALAEARFGYAAAMGAWPDYDHAATRSRALECSVVAAEIEAGDLAVARRTFNQLDDPPPSLARRLETVEAARQQSQRRWQALETMSNTATGQRARTWVVGLLCTLWVVAPLFRGSLARVTPMGIVAPYLASVLVVGALVFVGRASLFDSYVNRSVTMVICGVMGVDLLLAVMAVRYDLGFVWLRQTLPIVWASAGAIGVGLIDRRFWPAATAMGLLCFAVRELPQHLDGVTAAANAVLLVNALWLLRSWTQPPSTEPASSGRQMDLGASMPT